MSLRGRIRDTIRTLFGRSEAAIELAKMRAEYLDLMIDVTSALEKLNTMAARFAKRESRELAKEAAAEKESALEGALEPRGSMSHSKTELYNRARARKGEKGAKLNVS